MESHYQSRSHPLHESPASPTQLVLPSVAQLIASSSASPSIGSIPVPPNSSLPPSLPPILCPSPPDHLHSHTRHTSRASPTASAPYSSAQSHRPTNTRRQDSAISHLIRNDMPKEVSSLVQPSEPDFSYSNRSPNSSHHSTSPTSPGYALSHSAAPAHEHVTASLKSSHSQPVLEHSNRTHSPPYSDSSHTSTTRQPRFNVRFATNHTPENMPSAHRPRHSPPPPVTVPPPQTLEQVATPQAEPVRPPINDRSRVMSILLGHPNGNSPSESDVHEGPERCPGCHEAWSVTPMNVTAALSGHKLAESPWEQAIATGALQNYVRQHDKENAEAFELWKKKHSQCPVAPTSPPQNDAPAGLSNKRKSEGSHGDVSKRRGVPNGHTTTAPPVQSSTST